MHRDKITPVQQSAAPHLHKGDLLGRIDTQCAQPDCVAIGPFGLAGAEHAVKQAVEKRNMPVALDRKALTVNLE